MLRDVDNRVHVDNLIKALLWCKDDRVRDAFAGIYRRTDDPRILTTVLPGLEAAEAKTLNGRLEALLEKLPESEEDPGGEGHYILSFLIDRLGEKARPLIDSYLRKATLQRSWTVCDVLMDSKSVWAKELLIPLLVDKRQAEFPKSWSGTYKDFRFSGQQITLRLCDKAAWALSELDPDLKFKYSSRPEELDAQIEVMRKKLAGKN